MAERTFHNQRKIVVQLLKDWADQFGSTTIQSDRGGGDPGGHWLLGSEILKTAEKDTRVYESKRLLARELRWMRENSPLYTYLKRTFLTNGSAHSAYDELRRKAERDSTSLWQSISGIRKNWSGSTDEGLARSLVTYWENNASDEVKTEHAIDVLTRRCMAYDLDAEFATVNPHATGNKTRTQTMQEQHAEIRRVFDHFCQQIREDQPKAKRYRNKAINNTATVCDVSTRTVMRAINAQEEDAS